MVAQNLSGPVHNRAHAIRALPRRQMGFDGFARNVVWWREPGAGDPAAPDHQMAVADPVMKLDPVAAQRATDIRDKPRRFLARDMARGEVIHAECAVGTGLERHQIHAKNDVIRTKLETHAGRFDRRATRVIARRVVAKHGHRADIAARRHPLGNRRDQPEVAARRDPVHVGFTRGFERRLAAQLVARPIRHPVAMYDDVLHVN